MVNKQSEALKEPEKAKEEVKPVAAANTIAQVPVTELSSVTLNFVPKLIVFKADAQQRLFMLGNGNVIIEYKNGQKTVINTSVIPLITVVPK